MRLVRRGGPALAESVHRSNQEAPNGEERRRTGPHCVQASRRVVYAAADPGVDPVRVFLTELAGSEEYIRLFGRMAMIRVANVGCQYGKTQLHVVPAFGTAWSANHAVDMALDIVVAAS